jgi:hypothetical protein
VALEDACDRVGYGYTYAGHDFWFTRNGHGAGFWDRVELGDGRVGERLTVAARAFNSVDAYEGDDHMIHLM